MLREEAEALTRRNGLDTGKSKRVLPVSVRGLFSCLRVGEEGGGCHQPSP